MEQRYPGLEIDEDMRFHKAECILQRVGRALLFLFLAAAVLGVFGEGPFSKQTASNGLLEVDYERFGRMGKNSSLEVRLAPAPAPAGAAQRKVWINNEFLKRVQMEQIQPEPQSVQTGGGGLTYIFETESTGEAASICFHFRPERFGRHTAVLRVDGQAAEVALEQMIYP